MCQTLQRCTIFHFGYSKIFVPFISSGSNLHQFLTAHSLPSKTIRLFTPNFKLTLFFFCAHFWLKWYKIFSPIKLPNWPILSDHSTTRNFLLFLHWLHTILEIFAASYVKIATHCHFNVVNFYIYRPFAVNSRTLKNRVCKKVWVAKKFWYR